MSLGENLQRANWPEKSGEYKVVQLEIDGQPYLRFPIKEYGENSHAGILMVLFRKNDIRFQRIEGVSGATVPALKGEKYKVHGMGKAKIDAEQMHASFYGNSLDYDIGINAEHLNLIKQLEKDWKIESGKR